MQTDHIAYLPDLEQVPVGAALSPLADTPTRVAPSASGGEVDLTIVVPYFNEETTLRIRSIPSRRQCGSCIGATKFW